MKIINKEEIKTSQEEIKDRIMDGEVFIHPTDTIYGIGCDATNPEAVSKIRNAKSRFKRPFSVIAPSLDWIHENCEVGEEAREWLDKLPGPYTFIFKMKNPQCVDSGVHLDGDTIGVRMPDHWFSAISTMTGKPIITTSANKIGEDYMKTMDDLDPNLKEHLHFAIYEGAKKGSPSTIVHLENEEVLVAER